MIPTTNATTRMILRKLGFTAKQHKGNVRHALDLAGQWSYELANGRDNKAAKFMTEYTEWINFLGYDPLANTLIAR